VPRRCIATYFEASAVEKTALWALVDEVKLALDAQLRPDGYNIGFDAGEAAGQTVLHLHIHVIPRFSGDVNDPGGGVRLVLPLRAHEVLPSERRPLAVGGERDPFGQHLWPLFATATEIAIVAAFVTETGLNLLQQRVMAALRAGTHFRIVTGDYLAFNQVDALRRLLEWSEVDVRHEVEAIDGDAPPPGQLRVRVVETALADGSERAFHPNSWLFEAASFGVAFVGSSNLSASRVDAGARTGQANPLGVDAIRVAMLSPDPAFRRTRVARRRSCGLLLSALANAIAARHFHLLVRSRQCHDSSRASSLMGTRVSGRPPVLVLHRVWRERRGPFGSGYPMVGGCKEPHISA